MKENIILTKSFDFSLKIIGLYKLLREKNEFLLSKQLFRSGTSIGANIDEAIAAQSRKDFISKLSIAAKESRETLYWLRLLEESELIENIDVKEHVALCAELKRILTSIILSTQKGNEE